MKQNGIHCVGEAEVRQQAILNRHGYKVHLLWLYKRVAQQNAICRPILLHKKIHTNTNKNPIWRMEDELRSLTARGKLLRSLVVRQLILLCEGGHCLHIPLVFCRHRLSSKSLMLERWVSKSPSVLLGRALPSPVCKVSSQDAFYCYWTDVLMSLFNLD